MWIDILMVVLWVFAVWVCIYDWEGMDDGAEPGPEPEVEGKNGANSWQNRGKTGLSGQNGNKFPESFHETDSKNPDIKL